MTESLVWLQEGQDFPHPETALTNPNGLLAAGGDLGSKRLIEAYKGGIFPWFSGGQPPLWWSPDPRAVLLPGNLHIARSLRKHIRQTPYTITTDQHFREVIDACAENRSEGTWILPEVRDAYVQLHELGWAHSVEVWYEDELAGGLYGVAVGRIFCGESMFSRRDNASKTAFVITTSTLFSAGYVLIDCQLENPHLQTLGVGALPRPDFLALLRDHGNQPFPWPGFEPTPGFS